MNLTYPLKGGVHPPEFKELSNQAPIATLPIFDEYVVPLKQHTGVIATACVEVGDHVLRGTKIGEPTGYISGAIHAPTSGTVVAIEPRVVPHASGLEDLVVVIKSDGLDTSVAPDALSNWRNGDVDAIIHRIRDFGVSGLGGASFPTSVKLKPTSKVDTLIINGAECEPYITADDMLMRERAADIKLGIDIIAKVLGFPKNIIIGIEDNKPEAIGLMKTAFLGSGYKIVTIPTKYPSGGEKQLIQILTGKEVPHGALPSSLGIAVQNVGTAVAIKEAVVDGTPLTERVTTFTGHGLKSGGNLYARIGTKVKDLLTHVESDYQSNAVIMGGPMMGFTLPSDEVPVVKATNCLLVPHAAETKPAAMECIRCGICAEACPADLLPQQLYWYSKADDHTKLEAYHLQDCIECGACAYVCPSKIELVQYYRAAKAKIKLAQENTVRAERARQRFEFRKSRLEAAEAEKEAKRLARKAAAESAKRAKTEAKVAPSPQTPAVAAFDPLAAAKAKLAKTKADESTLLDGRIEKQLKAANAKVEFLLEQIETARSEQASVLPQLESKLAAAKRKVQQLESKKNDTANTTDIERAEKALSTLDALKRSKAEPERKAANLAKINANIERCKTQLNDTNDDNIAAKLRDRLAKLEQKLKDESTTSSVSDERLDSGSKAAQAAIDRAKADAAKLSAMSPQEKQAANLKKLEQRYEKAIKRLKQAEADNSEHVQAFRDAAKKLQEKLKEAREDNHE